MVISLDLKDLNSSLNRFNYLKNIKNILHWLRKGEITVLWVIYKIE